MLPSLFSLSSWKSVSILCFLVEQTENASVECFHRSFCTTSCFSENIHQKILQSFLTSPASLYIWKFVPLLYILYLNMRLILVTRFSSENICTYLKVYCIYFIVFLPYWITTWVWAMVPPVATCHSVFPTITDAPLGIWGWGAQMAKMKATPHKYISMIVQICIGRQQRNYSAKYQITCFKTFKIESR